MQPDTHYARSADGVRIAYQVLGDGPRDLVLVPGWIFNLEIVWEHPSFEKFMKRLLRSFRVIMFDKRGTGLSDRDAATSAIEHRMDDVRAVMDAVGSEKASLMGWSEGGNIAALFAATAPERVECLVMYAAGARYRQAPDYPIGFAPDYLDFGRDILRNHWGEGFGAYLIAPSRAQDESFRKWFGRFERLSVSPGHGEVMLEANMDLDTTEMLKVIKVPTLILHNTRDGFVPVEFSRYIAEQMPDAKLVEMEGEDHLFWFHNPDEVVGELESFILGARTDDEYDRVLSTVVFTDIVDSTSQASSIGDARWRELLDTHDRLTRDNVHRFQGRIIKLTGDGALATFDGPARAVTCAARLQKALSSAGLQTRAGVHTGEIELRDDDVGGVGVHIAARIVDLAEPGEVLASRTVKDLSAGATIDFQDRGVHALKGLAEPWRLFAATI
jgi:pimeloyl-ACP methyl ester carboxylesterase/class 3 adenylate cyclase